MVRGGGLVEARLKALLDRVRQIDVSYTKRIKKHATDNWTCNIFVFWMDNIKIKTYTINFDIHDVLLMT
jgi:hypothetical protein